MEERVMGTTTTYLNSHLVRDRLFYSPSYFDLFNKVFSICSPLPFISYSSSFYSIATAQWKKVATKDTPLPDSRYGHSIVAFENELYMFGGYDHHGFACDDLHVFNFKTAKWTKVC